MLILVVLLCFPPTGGEGRGEEGEAGAGQLAATDQGPGRQGQDTGQVHEANLEEIWTYSLTNLLYVRTMHLRTYTEHNKTVYYHPAERLLYFFYAEMKITGHHRIAAIRTSIT